MPLPNDLAGRIADAKNFFNIVSPRPDHYGLTTAQLDLLEAKYRNTEAKIAAQAVADSQKIAATADKKEVADDFTAYYLSLRGVAQANPTTTDAMRAPLNLATGAGEPPNLVDFTTAPLLAVEPSGVHAQRIRFFMAGEPSTSTKKPKQSDGAKIYLKIDGVATTDLKDYELVAFDRKSPYEFTHEASDAGKTAHYIAMWANDEDDHSPQSEVFSLIIT